MNSKKCSYLTVSRAAEILRVHPMTVRVWLKKGRIHGVTRKHTRVIEKSFILESSLRDAFKVKCLWCGAVFASSRPGQGRYCCRSHKDKYLYANRDNPEVIARQWSKKSRTCGGVRTKS